MGRVEAGAVAQAFVGPESNNGPVGEVNTECVNFFKANTKTNYNNSVHLQQPHNILNRTACDVPVVTDLGCRLFDIGRSKGLSFLSWDARQIEVGQRDVLFELEREFPCEVHVGERLLAISRGGRSKAAEESANLILSRGAGWGSEEGRRYPQRDREPPKRRCGRSGVPVLELTERGRGD